MADTPKKGYWIAHVEVHDPEQYKNYVTDAAPAFVEYGAEFLARGGEFEIFEGEDMGTRHVVSVFKDFATAKACYESETYQNARKHRLPASSAKVMIVEGA